MRLVVIAVVVLALVGATGYAWKGEGGLTASAAGGLEPEAEATDVGTDVRAEAGAAASSKSVVYQWVDDRGSVHFAGSLDEVPADWRERAGQIELDASPPSRPKTGPSAEQNGARRVVEVADAQPAHDVTVYTAPWCGWCRKTLAFLDEAGVAYVNKDIEADVRWADELREKTGGNAIPLVEIDGSRIRGFDPDQMTSLLR